MKRGRRFVAQLVILPALWFLDSLDDKLFQAVISLAILIEWPITVAVAGILIWLSRQVPEIETLVEAADNALTEALRQSSLVFVAAAVILRLVGVITVPIGPIIIVLLSYAIVLGGVP